MIKDTFKPIPKYMLKLIKETDLKLCSAQDGHTRFYSYLTKFKKQLIRVTVAVRNYRKKWLCKQVALHGVHSSKCYIKDMVFYNVAGYKVGWYEQGIGQYRKWFESHEWDYSDDKYFKIHCPIINKEFINKFPEYKYSAIELYEGNDIFNYLRLYEKYPQVEYLTKAGLQCLATSKMILNQCKKDKNFCKWIFKNKNDIKGYYYTASIIKAYKQNKPIAIIDRYEKLKKELEQNTNYYAETKSIIKKEEVYKCLDYMAKHNIKFDTYNDYIKACLYLKLDMSLDKNKYPHDFKFWHDTRIDEYNTAKIMADKKEREELYKKFGVIACKYQQMQRNLNDAYCVIIAQSPADLINEGNILHHCVGKMGYDQKFIREESLIFFVRNKNNPQIPFVTVEYSLKTNKILQCYAEHNTKPQQEVQEFINKKWLPYANRKLKAMIVA